MGRRACLAVALLLGAIAAPGGARADGASPTSASAAQKADAQAKYDKGARLLESGRRADALEAFRASFETVASPNALLMIATTQADLGELVTAYETYEAVERAAEEVAPPKYRAAGAAARTEREGLRPRVALVTVRILGAAAGARVRLGGREIPPERWGKAIPVKPGDVALVATASNGRTIEKQIAAPAGGTTEVPVDLSEPPPPVGAAAPIPPPTASSPATTPSTPPLSPPAEEPHRRASLLPYAIAAGAVGVTGLGVFIVAGAMNRGTYHDLEARCPDQRCTADAIDDVDAGRREQTAANVGAVFAIGGLGAGLALFLIHRARSPSAAKSAHARASGPTVWVADRSVGVRGGF